MKHAFLSVADFFFKINLFKNFCSNTIRVSNSFDPDTECHSVGPELRQKSSQRLSAEDKVAASMDRVNSCARIKEALHKI